MLIVAPNNVTRVGGSLDLPQLRVTFRVLEGSSPRDAGELVFCAMAERRALCVESPPGKSRSDIL